MTYGSRLRAKTDQNHPSNLSWPNTKPSFWVLERMAEEEFQKRITGGFDPKHLCTTCFVALPVTGQCDYCS